MKLFRLLSKSFYVDIKYQNPLHSSFNVKLQIDLCQNNQQWYFRLKNKYERECIQMISKGMRNADVFVDIGSNIGIYAITIAQVFPTKKVIAVEPLKENIMSLERNILLNSINNVEVYNAVVLNSKSKKAAFYPNPINDGGGSTIKGSFFRTGDVLVNSEQYQKDNVSFLPEIEIDSIRIDDIINSKSVIKIDVEGAEVSVLESGSNVFEHGLVDMMIIEVLDDTIDKAISILDNYGFDCFTQNMDVPIKAGTRLSWYVGNIICLRRKSREYKLLRESCSQIRD